jgi:hypothetical protein
MNQCHKLMRGTPLSIGQVHRWSIHIQQVNTKFDGQCYVMIGVYKTNTERSDFQQIGYGPGIGILGIGRVYACFKTNRQGSVEREYCPGFREGDVIGVCCDLIRYKISFKVNGVQFSEFDFKLVDDLMCGVSLVVSSYEGATVEIKPYHFLGENKKR